MFQLSDNARKELIKALEKSRRTPEENLYIRIAMGIGWGGPQLQLALEEQPLSTDEVFEFEDEVKILINERDRYYLDGKKLDFQESMFGHGRFDLVNI